LAEMVGGYLAIDRLLRALEIEMHRDQLCFV
jgi:hypothetical protein